MIEGAIGTGIGIIIGIVSRHFFDKFRGTRSLKATLMFGIEQFSDEHQEMKEAIEELTSKLTQLSKKVRIF